MSLRISVITAVRNCESTVAGSLKSVQAQRWPTVEHVVIDGASTDDTLGVIRRHRQRVSRLISEPDAGLYDALNKGLRAATGDVVGFLHGDDEYESPSTLEHVGAAFEDPAVEAVYGDLLYVRRCDTRKVVRYWQAGPYDRNQLAHGWMPPHPTFYARRAVYERFGGFDTRFRIAADYEHMLRILWSGRVHARHLPEVLVRMRTGGMSTRVLNILRKSGEDYAALRQNGLGALTGWQALFMKNLTKLPQFIVKASPT